MNSTAHSIAGLETHTLSGLPFWEEGDDSLFNPTDDYQDVDEDKMYSKASDETLTRNALA